MCPSANSYFSKKLKNENCQLNFIFHCLKIENYFWKVRFCKLIFQFWNQSFGKLKKEFQNFHLFFFFQNWKMNSKILIFIFYSCKTEKWICKNRFFLKVVLNWKKKKNRADNWRGAWKIGLSDLWWTARFPFQITLHFLVKKGRNWCKIRSHLGPFSTYQFNFHFSISQKKWIETWVYAFFL